MIPHNHDVKRHRLLDFPEKIRDMGNDNPVIRHIQDAYVHEKILTLHEALCQMVVHLASDSEHYRRELLHLNSISVYPPVPIDISQKF